MSDSSEDYRVQCCSKNAVSHIIQTVEKKIEGTIQGQIGWTDEQRKKVSDRFKEIFEHVMEQNVTVDGEPYEHTGLDESTSELEPVNYEKKKYTREVLLPEVDECVKDVANKRKNYPYKCVKMLDEQHKYEDKLLDKYQGRQELPTEPSIEVLPDVPEDKDHIERLQKLMTSLKQSEKDLSDLVTAQSMLDQGGHDNMDEDLNETSPAYVDKAKGLKFD